MTAVNWYRAGTATVTNNSRPVVGVNTAWLSQVSAGDLFAVTDANGNLTSVWAEIESVTDDTHLTLKAIWPATTASGAKYAILRNFTGTQPADLAARLSKLIAQYQITVDEMQTLLASTGTVTLTTLTGEQVQVPGLLGIAQQSMPAHEAKAGAHQISGVAGLAEALAGKRGNSDVVGVAQGGTGATDAAAARSALGAMSSVNPTSSGTMTHTGAATMSGKVTATGGVRSGDQIELMVGATHAWSWNATANAGYLSLANEGVGYPLRISKAGSRFVFGDIVDDGNTLAQFGGRVSVRGQIVADHKISVGNDLGGSANQAFIQFSQHGIGSRNIGYRYSDGAFVISADGSGTLDVNVLMTLTPTGRALFGPITDDGSALMQVGGAGVFNGSADHGKALTAQHATSTSRSIRLFTEATMDGAFNQLVKINDQFIVNNVSGGGGLVIGQHDGAGIRFSAASTQVSGDLLVGVTSGTRHSIVKQVAEGNQILGIDNDVCVTANFYSVSQLGSNGNYCAMAMGRNGTTNRSINAGGTINASGADYAEYEKAKKAFIGKIIKGAIVGFDADGKLTLNFDDAFSFGVKSTDPCMVGGDVWGTEEALGMKRPEQPQFTAPEYAGSQAPADLPAKPAEPSLAIPTEPSKQEGETKAVFAARVAWWQQACQAAEAQHLQAKADYADALAAWEVQADEYAAALAQYQADQSAHQAAVKAAKAEFDKVTMPAYKKALAKFEAVLEAARQTVDRVAYSGKVPVNVWNAKPGDYIVAVRADDGGIAGVVVGEAEISFAQYRKAVGRVRRIEPDGRALIAVIVH